LFRYLFLNPKIMEAEEPSWEVIKLVVQAQYNITAIGIVALVGIAAILIGINFIGVQRVKQQMKKTIKDLKNEMKEIRENMQELKGDLKISVNKEIQMLKAEKDRLFALIAWNTKVWINLITWSARGIEDYAKTTRKDMVITMVDLLIIGLKNSKNIRSNDKEQVINSLNYIPKKFNEKRIEIEELVNHLEVIEEEQMENDE